jgi:hypothetical protein
LLSAEFEVLCAYRTASGGQFGGIQNAFARHCGRPRALQRCYMLLVLFNRSNFSDAHIIMFFCKANVLCRSSYNVRDGKVQ